MIVYKVFLGKLSLPPLLIAIASIGSVPAGPAGDATSPRVAAKTADRGTLMIADFEEPDVLDRLGWNDGVSVSLTDQDAVTGQRALEVRVKPFSSHGNKWPYLFFNQRYFRTPVDLTRHSRIAASVRNVTDGLATVRITLSSKPYNDGGRNLEGEGFVIPGGATMVCSLPTSLFRLGLNDPSSVQMLMFVFPANERNAVYRIDAIQAAYDPVEGSPAEKLAAEADALLQQIESLEQRVNWKAVPAAKVDALRNRIPELAATVHQVIGRAQTAGEKGWRGAFNSSRDELDTVSRQLGEFALADKVGFHLWQRSPYTYVYRDALPDFASAEVARIDVKMARNEFRNASFMVTACDADLELVVDVKSEAAGFADAVRLRWAEFVTLPDGQEYGDVLVPLEGPLAIPRGESRELWLTFDARWSGLGAGSYDFRLELRDLTSGTRRAVPGNLRVWDLELPSYDILPNNAYVEYHNSEIGAKVPEQGVRHMKMYGVNMVYVLPNELPWPVKVDDALNITAFDATGLTRRIKSILKAWKVAPGDERLRWIFSLSGAPDRLLESETPVYPSAQWKSVLAGWLRRFREFMTSLEIADEDWMFVLADESSESVLVTYEIPFAEMLKDIDPRISLSCNASQVINDAEMTDRFLKVFDVLQPNLDALKKSPALRQWIGTNRRPLWTYRCESMAGVDRNLYDYYRVYAWDMLRYGITGTGIWTYCAQGTSPWGKTKRGIGYNLVFKHREKAEVVHSRRYELYREGADDYRYIQALLATARQKGEAAEREAQDLISEALADITANVRDVTRCEKWRLRLANEILRQRSPP